MPETSLHAALKTWYARSGDSIETVVDGYVIDIRRGEILIEIQTRSFSSLRPKLESLIAHYPIHLVHPIAADKWINRVSNEGTTQRRKSPKHGKPEHVFNELIYIPHLLGHPNFTLQILLTEEEEIWVDDGRGSWRRDGWRIANRKLICVRSSQEYRSITDYRSLLPADLPETFTSSNLAKYAQLPLRLAQKMAYTLRASGVITVIGRQDRAYTYRLCQLAHNV